MPPSPSEPHPPTDLQSFQSYIISSSPPNRNRFPDPNDFTTFELESVLHFTLATYQTARENLQKILNGMREEQICDVLIQAQETLLSLPTHPLAPYAHAFHELAFSAKFADDFRFRNLIVGLKRLILRLHGEKEKVEMSFSKAGDGDLSGDEDDWFLVGGSQEAEQEQRKLCQAIEEHLKTGKEEEEVGDGKVEIRVMMEWKQSEEVRKSGEGASLSSV